MLVLWKREEGGREHRHLTALCRLERKEGYPWNVLQIQVSTHRGQALGKLVDLNVFSVPDVAEKLSVKVQATRQTECAAT